jgi:DNA-binding GntR family transcriptional regulator
MQYKPRSQREHREILKACMRRDVRRAVEALEQHLGNTGKLLGAYLREQGRSETTHDARFAIGRIKE